MQEKLIEKWESGRFVATLSEIDDEGERYFSVELVVDGLCVESTELSCPGDAQLEFCSYVGAATLGRYDDVTEDDEVGEFVGLAPLPQG